ncbi:hypothetical protein D9M71_706560 [compost metagenome]
MPKRIIADQVAAAGIDGRNGQHLGGLALRDGTNVAGACLQRRAAIEQVDITVGFESFALKDIESFLAVGVDAPDAVLRGLGQHRHVDRVLRHQVGEERPAFQAAEPLGLNVG